MKRGKSWWQRRWAVVAALIPATSLAQEHPGLSVRPSGQTLQGPPEQEQRTDLPRPEQQQTALAPTTVEGDYFEAAMRGEAWAQTKLGKSYIASDDATRRQIGIELLRRAAEQSGAEALYVLATLSTAGIGVDQSDIDAFQQMKRAAELGSAEAQFEMAAMYSEGRGVEKNDTVSEMWLRKSADQKYSEAQFILGRLLVLSLKPDKQAEGIGYLENSSSAGHAPSAIFLADAIGNGKHGLAKDEVKAEELLRPLADRGNADCLFLLAALYQFGETFAARRAEALPLLERAAKGGHPDALAALEFLIRE